MAIVLVRCRCSCLRLLDGDVLLSLKDRKTNAEIACGKKAYDEDNGNDPIRLSDYIAALDAFESIVVKVHG